MYMTNQLPQEREIKVREGRMREKVVNGEEELMDKKIKRLSQEQVSILELRFSEEKKLELGRKLRLASEAGLDPKTVAVWFQNKRTSWKKKNMQEEYTNLKSLHNKTLIQNIQLQTEVVKLKDQLLHTEKEIEKLISMKNSSSSTTSHSFENNKMVVDNGVGPCGLGDDFFFMDHELSNYVHYFGIPNPYEINYMEI